MDGVELAQAIRSRPDLAGTGLVILTSSFVMEPARRAAAGILRWIDKPVRRSDLLRVLIGVLEGPAPVHAPGAPPGNMPARRDATILLVEDNPINQAVANAMLASFGVQVQLAGDGREALACMRERNFDLVLMDCQMPVMDGYEATAAIRALDDKRRAATPIVALTANSMQGDEQKCRAAGMDGFLAKPYSLAALAAVMQRWLPEPKDADEPGIAGNDVAREEPVLPAPLNERVLESLRELDSSRGTGLVHRILRTFRETVPVQWERIEGAVRGGDAKLAGQVAHMLKSSTGSIGAESLSTLYRQLEMLARENRIEAATRILPLIRAEQARVMGRIAEILPD